MSNNPTQVVAVELSFGSIEVHLTETEFFHARFTYKENPLFSAAVFAKHRWKALNQLGWQLSTASDALLAFHGLSEDYTNLRDAVRVLWDLLDEVPFAEEHDADGALVSPKCIRRAA